MLITATHINYYIVCQRKLWFFINGINMETTSDIVADGKLLHETSYPQRPERYEEITLAANYNEHELIGKIDFYDAKNKIIHEIKRSDKVEDAHQWQVKFYLWLLELNNVYEAKGILEYPKLRQTDEVVLTTDDKTTLANVTGNIASLMVNNICPPHKSNAKICKSCSYYELCYIDEL